MPLDVDHPRVATLRRPAPAQDMALVLFGVVGL
jgi:hypothetical protein